MSCSPTIKTERFELWGPRRDDLDGFARLLDDPETVRFLGEARPSHPSQWERLMRNAGCWAVYGYGTFMVRPLGSEEIIGSCGIFPSWREVPASFVEVPEAGWIVRRDHAGRGVAREVMSAAITWFETAFGRQRIVCMIEDGNDASLRLAAHLGFRQYATENPEKGNPLILLERLPAP